MILGLLFADDQPIMKPDPINIAGGPFSTFHQSTDEPYPVMMVANKFQAGLETMTSEHSNTSRVMGDHPDSIDLKPTHQKSDSDKPYTFYTSTS